MGPNPAIKAWQTSGGKLIRVISGAASGGAELVVKKGITSASQLKGQKLATPSLGNTQDVALRYWLKKQGLTSHARPAAVTCRSRPITPNSDAVLAFESGKIAGGWEPAPYDAEMLAAGGHALVNEASLWPKGQFVTTNLVATQSFISAHPSVISGLLKGQIQANSFIASSKSQAETAANAELATLSGKSLKPSILTAAFQQVTFTNDPIASSLITDAQHAVAVGPAHAGQEPDRALRSRAAQQGAGRGGPARGEPVSTVDRRTAPSGFSPGASARSEPGAPAPERTAVRLTDVTKVYGSAAGPSRPWTRSR